MQKTYYVMYTAVGSKAVFFDGPYKQLLDVAMIAQDLGGTIVYNEGSETQNGQEVFKDHAGKWYNRSGDRLFRLSQVG